MIKYLEFDSVTQTKSKKLDYGYNFRSVSKVLFNLDSSHVYWVAPEGTNHLELHYSFSNDTLQTSVDSLGSYPEYYVRSGNVGAQSDWVSRLFWRVGYPYPKFTSWVKALACSDSAWFVLSAESGYNKLSVVPFATDTVLSQRAYANVSAFDVVGSDLWLAGRFYIQKQGLFNNLPAAHFNIGAYFDQQEDAITAMTVVGNTIYLSSERFQVPSPKGRMIRFTTSGQFIDSLSTSSEIYDLASSNNRIWATLGSGCIYELDPVTMKALHSYYVVLENHFRYQGLAIRNGQLECADFIQNYLKILDVPMP